jgi:gluconolactonase
MIRTSKAGKACRPVFLIALLAARRLHASGPVDGMPAGSPAAVIDLQTDAGAASVKGQWRFSNIKIVEAEFGGEKVYDYTPHAGAAGFDDSQWTVLKPAEIRRGHAGKMSFVWYRITVTIPERVGDLDPTGATAVLETLVDDYGEIWVDGELPRWQGLSGGPVVAGFLTPNRLVIGRHVKPGQKIEIAIFVMNGPISNVPPNRANMHSAKVEFYKTPAGPVNLLPGGYNPDVRKFDKAADWIFINNLKLIKLADGFTSVTQPVWDSRGSLLLSDPPNRATYRYSPQNVCAAPIVGQAEVKTDLALDGQLHGSGGMAFDPQGRLTVAEPHRVVRFEKDGKVSILADQSAHDLLYRSDGALYFTGSKAVFSLHEGKLQAIVEGLTEPRGIALAPDENSLYITDRNSVVRYLANTDGTLSNGQAIAEIESAGGIQVDREGNLYIAGPGGVWILSSEGKHLGTMLAGKKPRHLEWGDADRKTLYLVSPEALYCVRLGLPGSEGGNRK